MNEVNEVNLKNTLIFAILLFASFISKSEETHKLLITEFMAINSNVLKDEEGDFSDWIEIYNPGETTISLKGWFLTDKADNLVKWEFPDVSLKADGYLVVFASEKDKKNTSGTLHTNFKLSGSGEFLAIVEPGGTVVSHSFGSMFPSQREDISYGLYQQNYIYFTEPSPGKPNFPGNIPLSPTFSKTRNFYYEPFDVSLSVIDGGTIYFSTNGSRPSKTDGQLYKSPIRIQTTTVLSAISYNSSGIPSEIITHTYIFPDSVFKQPAAPKDYPSTWSQYKFKTGFAPADYEMDPEVCGNPLYKPQLDAALKSIPTLSIVTNISHIFSKVKDNLTGGIYIFTGNSGAGSAGLDWERPASAEYFDPASGKQFQINCGLLLHGGNSRVPDNSQKHSFRLSFRSEYGPSKLNFRIFDDNKATNEFNALVLRAGYNYSWVKNDATQRVNAQYLQDPFAKNTQLELGHTSAHQRFVHLYLNGLYWGLYNISEKLTNDFFESYLGGDEDDYDVIKDHGEIVDGYWTTWSKLYTQAQAGLLSNTNYQKVQGKNPDGSTNSAYLNLIDIENLIDYMQLNMYIGNEDWDHNNWIAARDRVKNNAGFRFFVWDAETSMTNVNYNCVNENNKENPSWFYSLMRENPDFKILFADHIQRNFFNGGPLSAEACIARYQKLASEIDLPIILESARWGDYRKDLDPSDNTKILYTKNEYWLTRKQYLINSYFPARSAIVVNQFRETGLFPLVEAPVFNKKEGKYDAPFQLGINSAGGQIYYTTDGTDPRIQITSAVSPMAKLYTENFGLSKDITIKARVKTGSEWSPITEATYSFNTPTIIKDLSQAEELTIWSYPNPFKLSTTFKVTLPTNGDFKLSFFTVDGKCFDTIQKGFLANGTYEVVWNPKTDTKGVFIYKIRFNGNEKTGRIIRF